MAWLVSVLSPEQGARIRSSRPAPALPPREPPLSNGSIRHWAISKPPIVGTDRAIDQKHVPRYLAEFQYHFNRRCDLGTMMPRLAWAAVRTTPMLYRLLKLPEVDA
jgi:hypothetical protein